MIAKIYKLPSGLTSPDDKPDLQLGNELTSNTAYYLVINAETVSAPDLDTITVQTGNLGDLETQQLYLSNFINVGTFGYQITNIYYVQQTNNGVYMVEGKLDIYFSFLVSFFDETTTNNNRVYFNQKHLNRRIETTTITDKTQTTQTYLWPSIQQYLLNKHPALKDIGKQLVKTYHILDINNYSTGKPTSNIVNAIDDTSGTTTVSGGEENQNETIDLTVSIANEPGFSNISNYYTPTNYFSQTTGSVAYPVLIIKADLNTSYDGKGLFPYFLADGGQTGNPPSNKSTITISATNPDYTFTPYETTISFPTSTISSFSPLFNIASDYYIGLYLFPLPIKRLIPNGNTTNPQNTEWKYYLPLSNVLNQGIFANGKAGEPTFPSFTYAPFETQAGFNQVAQNIASAIPNSLCNVICNFINGNTFYATPSQLTPINNLYINNNFAVIEPAILNGMSFNVRLYGQDNLVRPLDFNYLSNSIKTDLTNGTITTTVCSPLNALYVYLNYFAITISPPNVMITNIPYHDLIYNVFNNDVPTWFPRFGAFNGYNDAVFSAMMKSEVPTPSTAGTNYIANSKNAYDMGLNISNLLAQNAQAEVQIARNNMGIAIANEIGGLGGAIGDIFSGKGGALGSAIGGLASGGVSIANASIEADTIAPNNADIQEMNYHYMASGKSQDMSRTTSMRVSATATTNTLNDTVYTVIDEVPPLYEQIYLINYYALHGYIVNKGDLWKYGFNRKICNYISCSFFTNAMLPNLNINGKTKIDALLNKGFRVGCYNDNQQVQINPTTTSTIDGNTIPYNVVLYNSFDGGNYIYNNIELSGTNGTNEIYYLYKGYEGTNEDVQAGVSSFQSTKANETNEIILPYKNCAEK